LSRRSGASSTVHFPILKRKKPLLNGVRLIKLIYRSGSDCKNKKGHLSIQGAFFVSIFGSRPAHFFAVLLPPAVIAPASGAQQLLVTFLPLSPPSAIPAV
jgi:hypothetical protein